VDDDDDDDDDDDRTMWCRWQRLLVGRHVILQWRDGTFHWRVCATGYSMQHKWHI